MSDIHVLSASNTDEFLAHFGIKGMKWGVRKARVSRFPRGRSATTGSVIPTRQAIATSYSNARQARIATGKAAIDRAGSSTGRAVLHIAGKQVAESLLLSAGKMATRAIPNSTVAAGVRGMLDGAHLVVTIKNINDGVMVAQAANAAKSATHSRGRKKTGRSR